MRGVVAVEPILGEVSDVEAVCETVGSITVCFGQTIRDSEGTVRLDGADFAVSDICDALCAPTAGFFLFCLGQSIRACSSWKYRQLLRL